jgi:hypothetical protein
LADDDQILVWCALWEKLAQVKPSSFSIAPKRLGTDNAAALAFLYARANDPQLRPLELSDAEAVALRRGRQMLRAWTGLKTLKACQLWNAPQEGMLNAIPQLYGAMAWSYAELPALRRQIVVSEGGMDKRRSGSNPDVTAAALVLHEELHAAYASAATPGKLGSRNTTSWNMDEAVVRCGEAAVAYALLTGIEPTAGQLGHWVQSTGWNDQILPLLDCFDEETPVQEYLKTLTQANIAAGRRVSDRGAANAIARVLGQPYDADDWTDALSS